MNEKLFKICREVPFLNEVISAGFYVTTVEGFFQEYEGQYRFIISLTISNGEYIHRKVNMESEAIVTLMLQPSLFLKGLELMFDKSELKIQHYPESWEFLIKLLNESEEL